LAQVAAASSGGRLEFRGFCPQPATEFRVLSLQRLDSRVSHRQRRVPLGDHRLQPCKPLEQFSDGRLVRHSPILTTGKAKIKLPCRPQPDQLRRIMTLCRQTSY
jgi:hypothetical protein